MADVQHTVLDSNNWGGTALGEGTWKLMGGGLSNPGSSTKLLFGLWIKIV